MKEIVEEPCWGHCPLCVYGNPRFFFFFLQGWRATLIPLMARAPVSPCGGTFLCVFFFFFPLFGFFSIQIRLSHSFFLSVLLWQVDSVVGGRHRSVEEVERQIEGGTTFRRTPCLKAMEERSTR